MQSTQASQETPSPPIHLTFHIKNPPRFFLIAALILLTFILVRNLWVADDAFITMRTVDNLLHGHGLVWNVGERVQAFTHPLWMFILAAFNLLFIEDPNLKLYYEKLTILTRGDLFAPGRLAEIIRFNLGGYNHLIEAYLFSLPQP